MRGRAHLPTLRLSPISDSLSAMRPSHHRIQAAMAGVPLAILLAMTGNPAWAAGANGAAGNPGISGSPTGNSGGPGGPAAPGSGANDPGGFGGNGGNGGDGTSIAVGDTSAGGNGGAGGTGGDGGSASPATGTTLTNTGNLSGGAGGAGGNGGVGGNAITNGHNLQENGGAGGSGGAGGMGAVGMTASSGATIVNSGTITGGNGGAGGNGGGAGGANGIGSDGNTANGGVGGVGGAGGIGAAGVTASDSTIVNSGTIIGGNGGAGGSGGNGGIAFGSPSGTTANSGNSGSGGAGGNGGNGGNGISGSHLTITNTGTISAGAGGAGGGGGVAGSANGSDINTVGFAGVDGVSGFAGGNGITGSDLSVTNSGTINNGITFTGGVNSLTLQAGSTINGNVVAFSAADTLALGGSTNASFDVSQIGPAAQYRNFGLFEKSGSSTWTLTGTTAATTNWTVSGGLLNFSAANNFGASGTITLNGGGLQWASGNTTDISSRLTAIGADGATFDTNGNNVALATALGGTGSLTKTGAGALNISGQNNYSGNTTVSQGTLQFDTYTQSSAQTVGIGARSTTDYGKLNVTGTATFNAGANLAVDVASINTLANGQTLTGVISAGTLNATTFNVTDNSALLNFTAVLNGNTVNLDVTSGTTISGAASTQAMTPAYAAARVLDTWSNSGDTGTVISAFNRLPDQASVVRAVYQTLPQNSGAQATMSALSSINRIIAGRFTSIGSGISTGEGNANKQVWIKPFGSHASQNDENNVSGFSADTYGLAAGVETDMGSEAGTRVGLSYAYASTRVSGNTALSGTDSGTKIDSSVITVYASKLLREDLALNLQLDTGWNNNRTTRNINFGGLSRIANGSYGALSFHTGAGVSKAISIDQADTFIPSVRIDYTRLKGRSYTETGADALNLSVDGQTTEAFVAGMDGRIVHAINAQSQLEANVGAGYDLINDKGDLVATYAGTPGQSFTTTGLSHGPWLFKTGLGYTYKLKQGTDILVRYDAEGRSGFVNQGASVKAAWLF
ncbi:MAG TPA: autotransporter domain-containing protein [Rhodocyclaceae bacterium]|nr:autotransporter domain-containing protein [Rhodocyclaceae bacterium]